MRLRLAARLAASRFASSRRGSGAGLPDAWLPLALRWRRRRRQAANVRMLRSSMPAAAITTTTAKTNTWFAHTHLHFTARVSDRTVCERFLRTVSRTHTHLLGHQSPLPSGERARVRGGTTATPVREVLRFERTHLMTTTRTATLAMQPRRANRPPRAVHAGNAGNAGISRFAASATAPERSPRIRIPIPIPTIRPAAALRPYPIFERARKTVTSNERPPSPERPKWLLSRELHVFRLPHATSVEVVTPRRLQEEDNPSPGQFARTPALVWRAAPRPQPETGGEGAVANPAMSLSRLPARSAALPETAPEAPRRSARAALQAADFDPALLDRLTDDVIRRVERRVRIERERRGL